MRREYSFVWLLILSFFFMPSCATNKLFVDFEHKEIREIKEEKFQLVKSDSYSVLSYARKGDLIYLKLRYGGGCDYANFQMLQNLENRNQVKLTLRKKGNCKSFQFAEYVFKLNNSISRKPVEVILPKDKKLLISSKWKEVRVAQ